MMSRIEYSWQVALQQSLLPLPRCAPLTRSIRFDLSAIHRPFPALCGTVQGSFGSRYTLSSVSGPAGLSSLNLRGRYLKPHCSRKWMSGHAVHALVLHALVLQRDRGQLATHSITSLGEPLPPSQRKPPFPLDGHLSWMCRICLSPSGDKTSSS
jgi:hypothetical protein